MRELKTSPTSPTGLILVDAPTPRTSSHEALVEVRASSVNRGELRLMARRPDGWGPGQDVAGIVVEQAANGTGPPAGTRVAGLAEHGAWAEYVVVPAARLVPIPDSVSFETAASLPIAAGTALALVEMGGTLIGRRTLITGAAGGVGRYAVQLASLAGAEVTAVVRDEKRAEGLARLGVSQVVHDILHASGPFEHILDSVGGESFEKCLSMVSNAGTIVSFGNSSDEPARYSFETMYHAGRAVVRFYFNYQNSDARLRRNLEVVMALVEAGRLKSDIGLVNTWTDAHLAIDLLRNRNVAGKAVLLIE